VRFFPEYSDQSGNTTYTTLENLILQLHMMRRALAIAAVRIGIRAHASLHDHAANNTIAVNVGIGNVTSVRVCHEALVQLQPDQALRLDCPAIHGIGAVPHVNDRANARAG
jgi:hypothetical protein